MAIFDLLGQTSKLVSLGGAVADLASITKALVVPDPNIPQGINGFLFDIDLTETVTLNSQITDHWIENNSTIQDHIAIEPVKVVLTGNVGELVWKKTKVEKYAIQYIQKLTEVAFLQPSLSLAALDFLYNYLALNQQINQARQVYSDFASVFTDGEELTNQQSAYQTLQYFFYARTLCTIATPWRQFTNMAIESLNFSQDPSTKEMSEVTVTFKQINMVDVKISKVRLQGPPRAQRAAQVNQGTVKGESVALKILKGTGVVQ